MKKKMKKKQNYFEKFMVCPNCRTALFRKSALKTEVPSFQYCGKCGTNISSTIKIVLDKANKN